MNLETLENAIGHWLENDATDVFLAEGQPTRLRINGEVVAVEESNMTRDEIATLWEACGVNPETHNEHDARHLMSSGGYLRVNLYRAMGKLSAAIRPIKDVIPPLDSLGLPTDLFRSWTKRRSGLVLVTGATGSGKSTTLASALDDLNQSLHGHIVTLEDPIEYIFQNKQSYFSQRELNSDTNSFSGALRASLRQNPDVIMIGEIRDEETAQLALRAAETGHLVLTTLHSSGVVETIERLSNLFPDGPRETSLMLLSRQLIGVVTQNLLPGIDGSLKLVCEYLENDGATRTWIREGRYRDLIDHLLRPQQAHARDMLTSIVEAYQAGLVDENSARNASPNPSDFDRKIRGIS
ncbi:MAG: twitching motility protein PilT [Akkermansiaceae bacterium]|jgi:twitching motility protein PilT|tara:strand:+ start:1792 stop:2847 length:1056 start_codon:yes stop_codon:yes gene_type:complete